MARANAAMPIPPAVEAAMPMKPVKVSARQPHGMSLAAKPERTPHPTAKGRDIHGRMLPGQLPRNAAPPFQPGIGRAMRAATKALPATAPTPAMPISLGRIPGRSQGY